MKNTAITTFLVIMCLAISGCDRHRPRILGLEDDLEKILKLDTVSSALGAGGTRGGDSIQSDQEYCLWIIPKKTNDLDQLYDSAKDSIISLLSDKGAKVVSSSSGASHGYIEEYQHLGGSVSSYTIVYKYKGGIGFVDVFCASYVAEQESGRIGINHIFIPYPEEG